MPPRQSVPRLRPNLLDNSPRTLSPSNTFDIKDIMGQLKPFPKLLGERFVFDDANDILNSDDGGLQDIPPFPIGRQPPLFILNSHRTRLPFPIRPEAFELGDFDSDEENVRPLLTIPTIPRMKLLIKERLYVQKWVDILTSDSPPKHIPWTCEKPATERKWTAEGSIFPAARSGDLCPSSEVSAPAQLSSTDSLASTSHIHIRSADVDPCILCEDLTTSSTPDAPLATRRGKALSGLNLKRSVIEQLEYPDIPTAFRGTPSCWPSQSDVLPVPSFTDHQSMLLGLQSKCAALGNGASIYIQESPCPRIETTRTSLSAEEWAFTRGLTTLNDSLTDSRVCREIVDDGTSTPANGHDIIARLGSSPRLPSTPVQSPVNRSSGPPGVPLPPRPALVNPSTPPHVRGILKKVKSVRFEDMIITEFSSLTSSIGPSSPERPSPPTLGVPSERPCTPLPKPPRLSGARTPLKEMPLLGKDAEEKNSAPRSRLPPKANGKLEPIHRSDGNPEASKRTLAIPLVERPCRIAHAKENTNPAMVPQPQAKQKGPIAETDVRKGIEGPAKSRLSTPLRNIFRFR